MLNIDVIMAESLFSVLFSVLFLIFLGDHKPPRSTSDSRFGPLVPPSPPWAPAIATALQSMQQGDMDAVG